MMPGGAWPRVEDGLARNLFAAVRLEAAQGAFLRPPPSTRIAGHIMSVAQGAIEALIGAARRSGVGRDCRVDQRAGRPRARPLAPAAASRPAIAKPLVPMRGTVIGVGAAVFAEGTGDKEPGSFRLSAELQVATRFAEAVRRRSTAYREQVHRHCNSASRMCSTSLRGIDPPSLTRLLLDRGSPSASPAPHPHACAALRR